MPARNRVIRRPVGWPDQGPMHRLRSLSSLFFIAFLIIAADQLLKFIMLRVLVYGNPISVIRGFFSLTLVFNTGAAFGILCEQQGLFILLPVLTTVFIVTLYLKSRDQKKLMVPLALLLGGTIGNFIDRVRYGCVVDFLDVYFRKWHWPAFNIADICICVGVLLFLIRLLKRKEPVS